MPHLILYWTFFFQLEIKGGAALDMEGEDVKVVAHQVAGDNTGRAVVHRTQSFNLTQDRALMEFAVVSQRESFVQLPPKTDCRKIDFIIKGWCLKEENMEKFTLLHQIFRNSVAKNADSFFEYVNFYNYMPKMIVKNLMFGEL